MKQLHLMVTGTAEDCKFNKAIVTEYDECGNYVDIHPIIYTRTKSKVEIYTQLFGVSTAPFSMIVDHIGGRPNDR